MISMCERCKEYNWRKMQDIIDVFRDAGLERPKHIWCKATNRPEDIQYAFCPNFIGFETITERHQIKSKQRYTNKPNNLSGHRKIKPRKA